VGLFILGYKLRIEVMVLRSEFKINAAEFVATLSSYKAAIEQTVSSMSLEEFLRLVLNIGNFMNKVNYN